MQLCLQDGGVAAHEEKDDLCSAVKRLFLARRNTKSEPKRLSSCKISYLYQNFRRRRKRH